MSDGYYTVLVDNQHAIGRFERLRDAWQAARQLRARGDIRVRNPHPIKLHHSLTTLPTETSTR